MAITFSVFLYRNNKMQEADQLDELKVSLADLRNNLGCGFRIGCVVNTKDNSMNNCRIPNAMAPVSVVFERANLDSTLFVFDASCPDSAVDATIGSKRQIWQLVSANFKLIFAVKH